MYTYITTFSTQGSGWDEIDISNIKTVDLLNNYKYLYIQLAEPVTETIGELIIGKGHDVEKSFREFDGTFSEWLTRNANNRLDLDFDLLDVEKVGIIDLTEVKSWGGNISLADRNLHIDSEYNSDGNDILVTKEGMDYSELTNSLFLVDGRIHPNSINENGVYIHDGITYPTDTPRVVSILDFSGVGGMAKVSVDSSMVRSPTDTGLDLFDYTLLTVNESLVDKTVGIVIDGFLELLSPAIRVVGERLIRIDWSTLPNIDRYLAGKPLPDGDYRSNSNHTYGNIKADPFIEAILDSEFTFLVLLEDVDLTVDTTALVPGGVVGSYLAEGDFRGFARDSLGHIYPLVVSEAVSSNPELRDVDMMVQLPVTFRRQSVLSSGVISDSTILRAVSGVLVNQEPIRLVGYKTLI